MIHNAPGPSYLKRGTWEELIDASLSSCDSAYDRCYEGEPGSYRLKKLTCWKKSVAKVLNRERNFNFFVGDDKVDMKTL
jgi:hypothetical protein